MMPVAINQGLLGSKTRSSCALGSPLSARKQLGMVVNQLGLSQNQRLFPHEWCFSFFFFFSFRPTRAVPNRAGAVAATGATAVCKALLAKALLPPMTVPFCAVAPFGLSSRDGPAFALCALRFARGLPAVKCALVGGSIV